MPASKPDFLIVGAMKAGTTTLFRDLIGHPDLFLPEDKEPDILTAPGEDLEAKRRDYEDLFARSRPGQLCGEASTSYTKRPDFEGVAERALRLAGPDLRIIYLVREPISRIVSHYKHEAGIGLVTEPLNEAVLRHERFVAYSRYDWQIAPWIEAFGEDRVLRLSFENYIANRHETVTDVCRFLGVNPALAPAPMEDRAFNASERKPTATRGILRNLVTSRFYLRRVKPLIPWHIRDRLATLLLPRVTVRSEALDDETRALISRRLAAPAH